MEVENVLEEAVKSGKNTGSDGSEQQRSLCHYSQIAWERNLLKA